MRKTALGLSLLLLCAGMACAQQELPPSIDGGPLTIKPEVSPMPDEPVAPKPDAEGVYSISPGIVMPVLLQTPPIVASVHDMPECDPPIVVVSAVIRESGHAEVRDVHTPRGSPCANLAALTVKKSLFRPATLKGRLVAVKVCLRVPFIPDMEVTPTFQRCPVVPDRSAEEDEDTGTSQREARRSASVHTSEELAPSVNTGPSHVQAVAPMPDEHGVYSPGPGIQSPVLVDRADAGPAEAVAGCRFPVVASAVVKADGSAEVRGIFRGLYGPDDKACDHLAVTAMEQSRARPAMLKGSAVPVLVCEGVPFPSSLYSPSPRFIRCPRDKSPTPDATMSASDSTQQVAKSFTPVQLTPGSSARGVTAPIPIYQPEAEYPSDAKKKISEGVCRLSLIVDVRGNPQDVRLEHCSDSIFVANSFEAAARYRFKPAMNQDGEPVPVRVTIEVHFIPAVE